MTCECEHEAHFALIYKGDHAHSFGADKPDCEPVKTLFGTYSLCNACREARHGDLKETAK